MSKKLPAHVGSVIVDVATRSGTRFPVAVRDSVGWVCISPGIKVTHRPEHIAHWTGVRLVREG